MSPVPSASLRTCLLPPREENNIKYHFLAAASCKKMVPKSRIRARVPVLRTGLSLTPFDNAMAESFIETLKRKEVYLWEYETPEDVQKRIPYFIQEVYNQKECNRQQGTYRLINLKLIFLRKNRTSNPVSSFPTKIARRRVHFSVGDAL